MKLKRVAFSTLLLSLSLISMAYNSLEVKMTDGSSSIISINELSTVTFSGDKLVISTAESVTELERSKIKTFSYISTSNVEGISTDGQPTLINNGKDILFSNLPPNSRVSIHDISGKLIKDEVADDIYHINVSDLTAGIYVVTINGISTKISVIQ